MIWDWLIALALGVPFSLAIWTVTRSVRLREFTDPARVDALTERQRRGLRFNAEILAGGARLFGPLARPAARTARQVLDALGDRGRPRAQDARQRRRGWIVFTIAAVLLSSFLVGQLAGGAIRPVTLWIVYVTVPILVVTAAWSALHGDRDNLGDGPGLFSSDSSDPGDGGD